jgi:hypothetical protein
MTATTRPNDLAPATGRPLPAAVRAAMEYGFGADFATVRIYEGPHVIALGARAYACGEEIHFAPGAFAPDTRAGLELLAHELAHVLQQRQGRVASPPGGVNRDPRLEAEAAELGRRVTAGERFDLGAAPAMPPNRPYPIQCAVGFEFQMDWQLRRKVKAEEDGADDTWEKVGQADGAVFKDATGVTGRSLSKVDRDQKCNFVVEGDDGDVEFVTPAFESKDRIDQAAKGFAVFERAIAAVMTDDGAPLKDVRAEFDKNIVAKLNEGRRNKLTAVGTVVCGDVDDVKILNEDFDDKTARPQATVSATLDRFGTTMEAFDLSKPLVGSDDHASSNFNLASIRSRRAIASLDEEQDWSKLQSLLAMVLHYLLNPLTGFDDVDATYAKASFPLMLRNDFHSLYAAMRGHEQTTFTAPWVMSVAGVDGESPVFPNGFKDQGLGKICFGPSRTDWVKSIIDPASGNAQAAEGDERVLQQNKDLTQSDLNEVDLMSRGDVRSSSAAMGAYPLNDELVIAEWRGLRPKSLPLDQFGTAMTETFDRATTGRELPEVAPIVTPTKTILSAQQIREDGELRELDGTKVESARDLVLLKRVYRLGDDDTKFLRFVDVTQAKGRAAVDKGDFKDHFWDEMWPTFQFVFATIEQGDEVELSEEERAALTEERERLAREDEEGEDDGEGEENGEGGERGGEDEEREGGEDLEEGSGGEEEEGEEVGGGRQGETFRGLQLVGGNEEEEEEEEEDEEEEEEEESAPPQQRRGRKRKVETYVLTPQQVTQMLNVQPAALKVGMRFGSYAYEGEHNGRYIFQAAA